jgi:hypothetical protein
MKWILWSNTVGELIIAIGMFSAPVSFFPGADGIGPSIARAFAFAILTVAFMSFRLSLSDVSSSTLKVGVGILLFYHAFQLLAQFVNAAIAPPLLIPPVIIHVIYSTLFAVYFLQLRRSSTAEKPGAI